MDNITISKGSFEKIINFLSQQPYYLVHELIQSLGKEHQQFKMEIAKAQQENAKNGKGGGVPAPQNTDADKISPQTNPADKLDQ